MAGAESGTERSGCARMVDRKVVGWRKGAMALMLGSIWPLEQIQKLQVLRCQNSEAHCS
jgi:hypothetical protein